MVRNKYKQYLPSRDAFSKRTVHRFVRLRYYPKAKSSSSYSFFYNLEHFIYLLPVIWKYQDIQTGHVLTMTALWNWPEDQFCRLKVSIVQRTISVNLPCDVLLQEPWLEFLFHWRRVRGISIVVRYLTTQDDMGISVHLQKEICS